MKVIKMKIIENEEINDYNCYTAQILNHYDIETGTYLIHFVSEFGSKHFLKQIMKLHPLSFFESQLKTRSRSGKLPLHFAA